ncbi:MAG: ankyrin repeat domain-containing protein [Deferribacteres bacterium]|nr:ankyrin repeat domain-containing protein [candidate division KSB1 bacterium]MCB9511156.1 ankyrin repeat domain-containing protein [Deferribacteres bacterium]
MPQTDEFVESVKAGKLDEIKALLKADPELIHASTGNGESVIMLAVYYGQKHVAQYLLAKATALTIFEATAVGQLERVKAALKNDASLLHAHSHDGWTAVHLAAFFGQTDILHYLIDAGAQINIGAKNEMKVLPLHSALANRQFEAAELLIRSGADVHAVQSAGWTALHYAAAVGNAGAVQHLLAAGADRAARTDNGQTPADIAGEKGHMLVVDLLRE